jgi:hypothetical protein
MIKKIFTWVLFALVSVLTLENCKLKPFDEIELEREREFAIPLLDANLSIENWLNSFDSRATLQVQSDGSLLLHYADDFISRSSSSIFDALKNVPIPFADTFKTGVRILDTRMKNAYINFTDIKSGKIFFFMQTPYGPLNVKIKIPQLTKNGQPFERQLQVFSFPPTYDSLDLAGWRLTPDNATKDSITIYHEARKFSDNSVVTLKNYAGIQIRDFQYSLMEGFLGSDTFDSPRDTLLIDFFKSWQNGEISFENPRMTISLENSFGFPVRSLMRVGDILTLNGQRLPIQSPLTQGVAANYPSLSEIGRSKKTVVVFDRNNSNLAEIVASKPVSIDYDIDGILNPDTSLRQAGFLTDSSNFRLQLELDLPLHARAKNFALTDTLPFSLGNTEGVKYIELKLIAENGLPLDAELQGWFTAADGFVIDSMFTEKRLILKGASVGSDGLPVNVGKQVSYLLLDATKLARLKQARNVILKYNFSTSDAGAKSVKITKSQRVRLQIGAKFGYQ